MVVKVHEGFQEDVKEQIAKLGFWGKIRQTTELEELMEWDVIRYLSFSEIDELRAAAESRAS